MFRGHNAARAFPLGLAALLACASLLLRPCSAVSPCRIEWGDKDKREGTHGEPKGCLYSPQHFRFASDGTPACAMAYLYRRDGLAADLDLSRCSGVDGCTIGSRQYVKRVSTSKSGDDGAYSGVITVPGGALANSRVEGGAVELQARAPHLTASHLAAEDPSGGPFARV